MRNKGLFLVIILTAITVSFMFGIAFGRKTATTTTIPTNSVSEPSSQSEDIEETTLAKPVDETTAQKVTDETTTKVTKETTLSSGFINVNAATKEDLMLLPGIGKVIAQAIIDYRNDHGPFKTVEDLLNVSGIGNKRLDAIRDYITVGG